MGYLLSAFFWAYGGFQILGGWLGDRLGSRHLLTILVLGWSLTTGGAAPGGPRAGIRGEALVLDRDAVAFRGLPGGGIPGPLPDQRRLDAGDDPGDVAGPDLDVEPRRRRRDPVCSVPMFAAFGTWRTPFWILCGVGVIWSTAFWIWFRDTPEQMPGVNEAERELHHRRPGRAGRRALQRPLVAAAYIPRSAWCLCLAYGFGGFSSNFFVGWLPTYLSDHRHLSDSDTKLLTSLPLAFGIVACISGGVLSD